MTHTTDPSGATHRPFADDFAFINTMDANLEQRLAYARALSLHLTRILETLMADAAALTAEEQKLAAAVSEYVAREIATVAALNAQITDLQAKGNPDTQPTIDALEAIIATIPQAAA